MSTQSILDELDAFIAQHLVPAPPNVPEYEREKTPPIDFGPKTGKAPTPSPQPQPTPSYPNYSNYSNYSNVPQPLSPQTSGISPLSTPQPNYSNYQPPRSSVYQQPIGGDVTLIPGQVTSSATDATLIPATFVPKPIQIRLLPKEPQFFPVISKELATPVKVGRLMPETEGPNFIGYDTKVVSRQHAEIFASNGEVFVKDTGSKSGTFLNNNRLSNPSVESKPFKLKDGDLLQFGVDFQGSQIRDHKSVLVTVYLVTGNTAAPPTRQTSYGSPAMGGSPMNFANLTLLSGK